MGHQIAVTGITGYPSRDHRYLACMRFLGATLGLGTKLGFDIPVYLADTSPPDIRNWIAQLATLVACPDSSYTSKKIASLQAAVESGAQAIFTTEMEKDGLVPDLQRICQPILDGSADLVIPERTEVSWASYPREFEIERFALEQIRQFTGHSFDTMLGAFAIHRDLASHFLNCQEEMWTWLHVPRFQFIRDRPDRVAGVPVDFLYPAEQKAAEERNPAFHLKRLEQLQYSLIRPLQVVYGEAKLK